MLRNKYLEKYINVLENFRNNEGIETPFPYNSFPCEKNEYIRFQFTMNRIEKKLDGRIGVKSRQRMFRNIPPVSKRWKRSMLDIG